MHFCKTCRSAVVVVAYWWERAVNSSNTNNFCNVNTNGNANNNNAYNSNGISPDSIIPKGYRSKIVTKFREPRPIIKGEMLPVAYTKLPSDTLTRTLLAWREDIVLNLVSCVGVKQFRRTQYRNCTEGE